MDRPERQQLKEALEAMQVETDFYTHNPSWQPKRCVIHRGGRGTFTSTLTVMEKDLNTPYNIALRIKKNSLFGGKLSD